MIPMAHEIEKKVMTCMDKSFIIKTEILHFKLFHCDFKCCVCRHLTRFYSIRVFISVITQYLWYFTMFECLSVIYLGGSLDIGIQEAFSYVLESDKEQKHKEKWRDAEESKLWRQRGRTNDLRSCRHAQSRISLLAAPAVGCGAETGRDRDRGVLKVISYQANTEKTVQSLNYWWISEGAIWERATCHGTLTKCSAAKMRACVTL